MKTYHKATLYSVDFNLYVHATDSTLIQDISKEMNRLAPNVKVQIIKGLAGQPIRIEIKKLGDHVFALKAWLEEFLCSRGWEPYAASGREEHFRLTIGG